jgi:hypothetical protein
VLARLFCRLVGHKWGLVPGVSHGHDELFECRRCGDYDWRDLPVRVHTGLRLIDCQGEDAATSGQTSERVS